jgi:mono/diheme cytochrome c family protein
MRSILLRTVAALALAAILAACTQKNTADEQANQGNAAANVALGIDRLLLFPNPIGLDPFAQDGGTFETDTSNYAAAYYAAIDATNSKDTIDKWRAANGFTGYAAPARPGTEHLAVFRDVKDLGYGRRMTGRRNSDDGSVVFYVENYNVAPNGSASYSSALNVDAAIRRDTQWHVGTNAIEWSTTPCLNIANGYPYNYDPPDCSGTVKFAKYYNFSSADGTRQLAVDLDGHGKKAMPGPCITCHGGRGDPLTPPDVSGNPRFPLVENSLSRKRGDVQARLHGQDVDSFSYSTTQAGFAKSDLQPFLKDFNQWILCTYPTPVAASVTGPWGTCNRVLAGANEWQGTAGPMIESWYGGTGMPAATFSDTYVPAGWNTNTGIAGTTFTDTALYQNVVAPYCRTCHILRGTKNQDDLDFMKLGTPASGVTPANGFLSYADRIKVHVFDRGNMPLAQIPHTDFWSSPAPQMLASFVDAQLGAGTATSNGAPLMPGRPIADPGPNRMVRTGANAVLTGENSLFASTFSWTNVSGPSNPLITNPTGMVAIFNAGVAGTYVVNLSVNGGASSKNVTITVDDSFPDPLNIKFAQVKNVLQNIQHTTAQTSGKCVACHVSPAVIPTPPIFYNSTLDRDNSGAVDATDEAWFLKAVQGRVNLTEIAASPLLRKPSGNHHKGLMLLDVADTTSGGGLSNYSILYNWILAGMQPGGVAANALVNGGLSPVALTFTGAPPFSSSITLDGTSSVGATSFLWSVSGPSAPTGALPFIASPTAATTVLNVPNVGTYAVQLLVSDGVSSDTMQRTITVTETPVAADFTPGSVGPPVNQSVSFSGTPLRGDIVLTSSSSGSPVSCQWQVTGPGGATLDGVTTPTTVTKSCGSPAILNVPLGSVGGTYVVTLTAISSLGTASAPVAHSLTVTSAGSGVVANAGASGPVAVTFTNPASSTPGGGVAAPDQAGIPGATVALNGGGSTGPGTLTYSWSITAQPGNATGAYTPTITSPTSVTATLNVHRAGVYTVSLFVSNGLPPGASNTATRTITVNANAITFTTMKSRFVSLGCTGCHSAGSVVPPSWVDETVGGLTLYQRVTARVNATDPALSPIVKCPSRGDCGMGQQGGFTNSNLTNYNEFLNWIMSGAPNN